MHYTLIVFPCHYEEQSDEVIPWTFPCHYEEQSDEVIPRKKEIATATALPRNDKRANALAMTENIFLRRFFMKKKLLTLLATFFTCATLAFGFVACNSSSASSSSAHEHNYTAVVTAPTCTEQGYTTYTCTCEDSYVADYVDALDHEFINYVPDVNDTKTAVCNRDGCNERKTVPDWAKIFTFSNGTITGLKNREINYTEIIILPEIDGVTVISIDDRAFYGCSSLTSVSIPDGVTSIGDEAFYDCPNLTSINIPDSVTSIGSGAFDYCNNLQYTIKGGLSYLGNSNNPYVYLAGPTSIYITTATIENGCKFIGDFAFNRCYSLTSVIVPDGITSIGYSAFSTCHSLASIEIPDSVTSIGDGAFCGCSSLTGIAIPDGITSIGNGAFSGCSSLASIVIPDSVTSIGYSAFEDCRRLTSIVLPDGVTSIGEDAFSMCTSLANLEIPNSVTFIGSGAFDYCNKLQYTIQGDLKYLGNPNNPYVYLAGPNSKNITTATIENGCKWIRGRAFIDYENLTSVTIPNSVTTIGKYAFEDCKSLTSVTIPNSVTAIGIYAFNNCSSLTIYCEAESQPSDWGSLWNYSNCPVVWDCHNNDEASDGYIYVVIDNIRYGIKDGVATVVRQASNIQTVTIPASITYKGTAYSVTSIGNDAFYSCSGLTSVVIGDSITSIGIGVFKNFSRLTNITVDENNRAYKSIDGNLYSKDGTTLIQYAIGKTVTTFTIPDSVTSIGEYAFYNCDSLTSVVIPDGVTSIGEYAFYNCRSLTSIIIPDSVTSIDGFAFYYCSNLKIYCEAESQPSGWHSSWNYSERTVVWGYKE